MNYEKLVNFEVDASKIYDQLIKLQESTSTLLITDKKALILEGYAEPGIVCCHLKIHNPLKNVVTFLVSKPPVYCLSITPKVGIVKPESDIWIYLKFNGRIHKIPDDGILIVSIYQAKLDVFDADIVENIDQASRIGRKYWSLPVNRNKEVEHILHFPIAWKPKKDNPLHEEHIDVFKNSAAKNKK